MEYLIPSLGRCGSTLLTGLLMDSTNRPTKFLIDITNDNIRLHKNKIIKTHSEFIEEFPFEYRAVFLYSDPLDIFASLYNKSCEQIKDTKHFHHLTNNKITRLELLRSIKILFKSKNTLKDDITFKNTYVFLKHMKAIKNFSKLRIYSLIVFCFLYLINSAMAFRFLSNIRSGFMREHLKRLRVSYLNIVIFASLLRINKISAFIFLAKNDKMNFIKIFSSWKRSKNTIFVNYNDLINHKKRTLDSISTHMELHLKDFEDKKRTSSANKLPDRLLEIIKNNYSDLTEILA